MGAIFLTGILIAAALPRQPRRGRPVSAPPEPPAPEPERRGDCHAGGPYASFYPEDDLGGWQNESGNCGAWEDLPEPEVDCRHTENFLAYWLAEKFLSDE